DFNGVEQEGIGPFQLTKIGNQRCSAARAYLTPILGRPNLTVMPEARLLRIEFAGKRTVGVEYLQGRQQIKAGAKKEVLICAGAVQSPQMLQLSGIGDEKALAEVQVACIHHLPGVGQNLQDHLDVVVQHHIKDPNMTLEGRTKLYKLPAILL